MTAQRDSGSYFSVTEEAFFREGNQIETSQPVENFEDLDEGFQRPSLWQRLFGKRQR